MEMNEQFFFPTELASPSSAYRRPPGRRFYEVAGHLLLLRLLIALLERFAKRLRFLLRFLFDGPPPVAHIGLAVIIVIIILVPAPGTPRLSVAGVGCGRRMSRDGDVRGGLLLIILFIPDVDGDDDDDYDQEDRESGPILHPSSSDFSE